MKVVRLLSCGVLNITLRLCPDGCHVAEVENPEHQDRFLSIGYKIYRGEDAQAQPHPKTYTKARVIYYVVFKNYRKC